MEKKICKKCGKEYPRKYRMADSQWEKSKFCSSLCYRTCREKDGNPHYKGGIHLRNDGYILIRIDSFSNEYRGKRYDLQHRIVVEQHIGRRLLRSEIVHHKNGNKSDNRIENLEITTHSKHATEHNSTRPRDKNGKFI